MWFRLPLSLHPPLALWLLLPCPLLRLAVDARLLGLFLPIASKMQFGVFLISQFDVILMWHDGKRAKFPSRAQDGNVREREHLRNISRMNASERDCESGEEGKTKKTLHIPMEHGEEMQTNV